MTDPSEPIDYYMRGPIEVHDEFIIVAEQEREDPRIERFPSFVVWSEEIGAYVFDPSAEAVPSVFITGRITETLAMTIRDVSLRDTYLNMDSDGFATRSSNRQIFRVATNVRAWPKTPLLAGASYLIRQHNDSLKFYRYLPNTVSYSESVCRSPETIVEDRRFPSTDHFRLRMVPLKVYKRGVCNRLKHTAVRARELEQQWILKTYLNNTACPDTVQYFTKNEDCDINMWYRYCLPFEQCGTNDCVGASNDTSMVCGYNSQTRHFEQERSESSFSQPNMWIFLSLLLIGMLICLWFVKYVVGGNGQEGEE